MYTAPTYEYKTSISLPTLGTIALLGGLTSTGATFDLEKVDGWLTYVQQRTQLIVSDSNLNHSEGIIVEPQTIDARTVAQHFANIRDVFSPSMSELAQDLGKSRQALYKWVSGENQPDDEAEVAFIRNMSLAADSFKKAGVSDAGLLLKMKAFDGRSLKDIIRSNGDWQHSVRALISESSMMEQSYSTSGLDSSKGVLSDDWKSSISIPSSSEKF